MNTKQFVDANWNEMRRAINKTYAESNNPTDPKRNDKACLRDYAENISWSDNLSALLGREIANERQHRKNRPSVPGFSNETAAKVILLNNIHDASKLDTMPNATEFLVFRQTAAEARVIGYLIRHNLHDSWHESVKMTDYSKYMKTGV